MSIAISVAKVTNVRKKFCRGLKRSLWYGVQDIISDLNPLPRRASAPASSNHLRKDEFWAIDGISFELGRGQCLGLIGHNGAGKTTLLKMLNGLIKPDDGRIEMHGRVGALIALGAGFNPILTGHENIYINGAVLGMRRKEIDRRMEEIIDFAELRDFIDAPVQSYSSGMSIRLGFAIAAHCKPDILLLDEVLAVGDISFQAKCLNKLAQFRSEGTSFIMVSHNMHQILRYADQVLYLRKGKLAFLGDPSEAVDAFSRDMSSPQEMDAAGATAWSRIYGSGRVILKKAAFIDQTGQHVTEITTGDGVRVRLDYERKSRLLGEIILDVVIYDKDGLFFQGTNAASGVGFGPLSEVGCLEVAFESIPANHRKLLFCFTLMDATTSEIYDWKRNVPLYIRTHIPQQGRVNLKCSWCAHAGDEEPNPTTQSMNA